MAKQIIFSTKLKGYQPVIWYGRPVYEHYIQLKTILNDYLGKEIAEVLSEPHITNEALKGSGKAHWMTAYIGPKGKSFSRLSQEKKEQIRQKIAIYLDKVHNLCTDLKKEGNSTQEEYAEILPLAFEIPGEEYIFIEDDKIVFACWGFSSDSTEQSRFRLSKTLPKVEGSTIKDQKEILPTKESSTHGREYGKAYGDGDIDKRQPRNRIKKKFPWVWLLSALLIIALGVIAFLLIKNMNVTGIAERIPNKPGKIQPIDPGKIIPNPEDPYKRKIVSNRLNIALEKDTEMEPFFKNFLRSHKNKKIKIVYYDTVIRFMQLQVPANSRTTLKNKLKEKHPQIKLIWDEAIFNRAYLPNDPGFHDSIKSRPYRNSGLFKAWDITQGDSNIVVAVIDDGFDLTHPEFAKNVVNPWNVPDHSTYVNTGKKDMYHGTHVASTAVGNIDNNTGVSGIAPKCRLMPIQVADSLGNMSFTSVICGILYAINKEADVINISLGMNVTPQIKQLPVSKQKALAGKLYPDEAHFWEDIFNYTNENNITVVIAAGNSNIVSGIDPMHLSEHTLVVAATDSLERRAGFSNFGQHTTVSAPGVKIYNAFPDKQYHFLDGTSMAAPIVSGTAALMKSIAPSISNKEIKKILIETGSKTSSISNNKDIGPVIRIDSALVKTGILFDKDSMSSTKKDTL